MAKMHQQKACRIIQAGQKTLYHGLQMCPDDKKLEIDGGYRHQPAAGSHLQHRQIGRTISGDVVLAGLGAALDHLAREQAE